LYAKFALNLSGVLLCAAWRRFEKRPSRNLKKPGKTRMTGNVHRLTAEVTPKNTPRRSLASCAPSSTPRISQTNCRQLHAGHEKVIILTDPSSRFVVLRWINGKTPAI
jgi:hypothetical protein